MRVRSGMLVLVGAGVLVSGCAGMPPPAAATPAAVAVGTASGSTAPTAEPVASSKSVVATDETDRRVRAQGYTVQMHDGEKLYCRREEVLGSRVSGKNVCATPEQINALQAESQASAEYIQRMAGTGCPNPCH